MKVILYMAISTNGMIARSDDDTSWISIAEWQSYSQAVQEAGYLIVGRRTYQILTNQPEFEELKDVRLIAVSHEDFPLLLPHHAIARSPQDALSAFSDANEVIVAGGGILNAAFLADGLVDEMYLDVEPIALGQGIPIFAGADFTQPLKLLGQKSITNDVIQLHYQVLKKGGAR